MSAGSYRKARTYVNLTFRELCTHKAHFSSVTINLGVTFHFTFNNLVTAVIPYTGRASPAAWNTAMRL